MFLRRLFYDTNTGAMLQMITLSGAAIAQSLEADAEGLANWAVIEWTELDEEVEAAFALTDSEGNPRNVNVSVDLSGTTPQLIFSYTPVTEPPQTDETADMQAALNLLGVVPEEETT